MLYVGGYVDLKDVKSVQSVAPSVNVSTDASNLESDAVFTTISEYVKQHPDEVKKINGIFLYHILVKGKAQATWSKYTYTWVSLQGIVAQVLSNLFVT